MSMRLLPKEPIMLRDTSAQDRVIEPKNPLKRHRKIIIAALAGIVVLGVLIVTLMKYSGAGVSVDRARVSIATVERGNFVRDIAADGQVVAAVSPTLYANALGTVALKVHAGDSVAKGQVLAVVDSPDLTAKMSQEEATLVGLRLDWQRAT
ncbi:MAG TPA: biotin/lipoyl-binding protein, partial [Steroidobacteraceae bacterium]